jgi:hypothetical protein
MLYYTIYVKSLYNGTGYIDVGLEDDQLLKDFLQYLDIGVRPHRTYGMANPASPKGGAGQFSINVADVVAITTSAPK